MNDFIHIYIYIYIYSTYIFIHICILQIRANICNEPVDRQVGPQRYQRHIDIYICGHLYTERFIIEIDFGDYGGWEIPLQAEDPVKLVAEFQSETEILRTSGINPSPKADELGCSSSTVRQEKGGKLFLPPAFILFRPSKDWVMLTRVGDGHLPCLVH